MRLITLVVSSTLYFTKSSVSTTCTNLADDSVCNELAFVLNLCKDSASSSLVRNQCARTCGVCVVDTDGADEEIFSQVEFTDWSECSVECGIGFQTRNLIGTVNQTVVSSESRECGCPLKFWSEWSEQDGYRRKEF